VVWLIAGFVLLISTTLAWLVDPRFIVFVAIAGLTSVSVAFTGFCPVGNILYRLGFRGLLADLSHPAFYFMQTDRWYLERRIYITVGVNITLGSILADLESVVAGIHRLCGRRDGLVRGHRLLHPRELPVLDRLRAAARAGVRSAHVCAHCIVLIRANDW
jgi:hypothetical protein